MAERIKARVGDTVETNFKLAYKKAEVARLPDAVQYQAIDFFMHCEQGQKFVTGAARKMTEHDRIQCDVHEVTQDDQPVSAVFYLGPNPQSPDMFMAGDLWKLYLNYVAKDAAVMGDPKDPRAHLLAEVELQKADPPPAKGS